MSTPGLLLLAEVLVPLMSLSDLCSATNLGLLAPLASPGEVHRVTGGKLLVRLRSVEIFPRGDAADDGAPIVDFDFFRLAAC